MEVSVNLSHLCVNLFGSMKAFPFVSFNYHFSLSCRVRQISFQPWIICLHTVLPIFFFSRIHFEWKSETTTWRLALIFSFKHLFVKHNPCQFLIRFMISACFIDIMLIFFATLICCLHLRLKTSTFYPFWAMHVSIYSSNFTDTLFHFHRMFLNGLNQINIDSVKQQ